MWLLSFDTNASLLLEAPDSEGRFDEGVLWGVDGRGGSGGMF